MVYKEVYRHQCCVSIWDVINCSISTLSVWFLWTLRAHSPKLKTLLSDAGALLFRRGPVGAGSTPFLTWWFKNLPQWKQFCPCLIHIIYTNIQLYLCLFLKNKNNKTSPTYNPGTSCGADTRKQRQRQSGSIWLQISAPRTTSIFL